MRTDTDLPDRRAGPFYPPSSTRITLVDSEGREIATSRSPRKLGKAIVTGELILLTGDTVIVGKIRVVS